MAVCTRCNRPGVFIADAALVCADCYLLEHAVALADWDAAREAQWEADWETWSVVRTASDILEAARHA